MPLSWNEIRPRAITFGKEWKGATREASERQTFWNEFFNVFGIRRRTVATFEFLFSLYEPRTAPLVVTVKSKRGRHKSVVAP